MGLNRKYVSEIDNFINDLIKNNPKIKQDQQNLRSTWWKKNDENNYHNEKSPGYAYYNYK